MAAPGGGDVIVVLDVEGETEGEAMAAPLPAGAAAPPPPPAEWRAPAGGLQAENERLLAEFVAFCSQHTQEHPEVMPYLASRHQKSSPEFLASVEFHNVLRRCLTRVQAQRSKVYVYINELCTVFKAHSQKKKQQQVSSTSPVEPPAAPSAPSEQEPPRPPLSGGSKRQIRYLENLLRIYAQEIQRLQAQELDLEELDSEDSAYLQESRLKRRMMRIFERLCELKNCNSLTGRVIEQRIPYRGTRYPEVNRRIERLINRPEAFPDYNDILKVVQKANAHHSLGLPKHQMVNMATNAFREVGERLQERRRLDLVYNFGSYLTDEYRRENDPALVDDELARRLRHNREVAMQRLDQVLVHYADLQDKSEERLKQAGPSSATGHQREQVAAPREPDLVVAAAAAVGESGSSPKKTSGDTSSPDHEEEEEGDEEEEEEESSSETDMEAELEKCLEGGEEEEEGPLPGAEPPAPEVEADQRMALKAPELLLYSSAEEEEEDDDDHDDEEEEEEREGRQEKVGGEPPPESRPLGNLPALSSPPSQQFLLEIEAALPLEASETPPPSPQLPPTPPHQTAQGGSFPTSLPKQKLQPPLKRSRFLENGKSCRPAATPSCEVNGQPPSKRDRQELSASKSSCIEVSSAGSSEEDGEGLPSPLSSHSPVPVADSTCADSPSLDLVTSTQGSPQPGHLVQIFKASVATQYDPEEIIILSDSD